MENYQYLEMFLEGIEKHSGFLPEHFKREQLKAEKVYVQRDEFIKRSIDLLVALNELHRTHIYHLGIHRAAKEEGGEHLTPKEIFEFVHSRTWDQLSIPKDSFSEKGVATLMRNVECLVDGCILAFNIKGEKNNFGIPEINRIFFNNASNKEKSKLEVSRHPEFNPNLWNQDCYELFKYLHDNYFNGKTIRQLTNIWFYLKEYHPENYTLIATKDLYKEFIKVQYGHDIKNFDKAALKYTEKDKPTMDGHRINFEENLLNIL